MPEYDENSLLPVSALQHLLFCERQCALIYLEQAWAENQLTAEGKVMHEKAHSGDGERRGDVRSVTGLRIRSFRLGLIGQMDVLECRQQPENGVGVPGLRGLWSMFPVEYKRGRPKAHRADEVQLCAQAICLEEMLGANIPSGALFYGQTRHRHDVPFDAPLRQLTVDAALRLHDLFDAGHTPAPAYDRKKCDACSLIEMCQPRACHPQHSVPEYLRSAIYHSPPSSEI
jgi:CRISPR-associated exonuclease Cas4